LPARRRSVVTGALVRYGGRVPDAGTRPSIIRFPSALGDAVVAAGTLRHGLGNAATGGIWRVRGTEGSAILKVTRLSAASELVPGQSQVGHTHVDRITALPPPLESRQPPTTQEHRS